MHPRKFGTKTKEPKTRSAKTGCKKLVCDGK